MAWLPSVVPENLRNGDPLWARMTGASVLAYATNRATPIRPYYPTHQLFHAAVNGIAGREAAFLGDDDYYGAYGFLPHEAATQKHKTRFSGSFGLDQAKYLYASQAMRLDAIAIAFHACKILNVPVSDPGNPAGVIEIHPALFRVRGFDAAYYNEYLKWFLGPVTPENVVLAEDMRAELFGGCGLSESPPQGRVVPPTFREMAYGLKARYDTCEGLIAFARAKGLPPLGPTYLDLNLNKSIARSVVEKRDSNFQNVRNLCAIEVLGF